MHASSDMAATAISTDCTKSREQFGRKFERRDPTHIGLCVTSFAVQNRQMLTLIRLRSNRNRSQRQCERWIPTTMTITRATFERSFGGARVRCDSLQAANNVVSLRPCLG